MAKATVVMLQSKLAEHLAQLVRGEVGELPAFVPAVASSSGSCGWKPWWSVQ